MEEKVKETFKKGRFSEKPWKQKPQLIVEFLKYFKEYTEKCITLTWRMVTQVPPLEIDNQSDAFNENHHEIARGKRPIPYEFTRRDGPPEKIAIYVRPGLLESGGRVIHRAQVVLFKE